MSYTVLWQAVVEAIRECAKRAADFGVTIGVQNHHDLAAHHDSLFDLIQAINETELQSDLDCVGSPRCTAWTSSPAAKKMAPITCLLRSPTTSYGRGSTTGPNVV